jgi:hypothetical protein
MLELVFWSFFVVLLRLLSSYCLHRPQNLLSCSAFRLFDHLLVCGMLLLGLLINSVIFLSISSVLDDSSRFSPKSFILAINARDGIFFAWRRLY